VESFILPKADLNRWLEMMHKGYEVFAPSRNHQEIFFSPISAQPEPELDLLTGTAVLPYLPPKDIVFPQAEVMFTFSRKGEAFDLAVPENKLGSSVLLGIRACDTTGIRWMDKFYLGNFRDDYYSRRRDNIVLVTLACNQPVKNCFCVCCEGGPFLNPERDEFDLQLVDLQESYLVECNSPKGKTLIDLKPELFHKADPSAKVLRDQLEETSRRSFLTDPTSYMSFAIRRITENSVPPEVWTELGERCFDDGGCTFVCPCCSCFGVGYLAGGDKGCHYRFWDSCDYSGFTREVSGHNPRGDKGERFKRRFYHKLSYQYVKRDGRIGCVGCGRCITACPGEVGMPAVVERI
jgi:sulfhydrogenase subunit beta (sulfur reductase)